VTVTAPSGYALTTPNRVNVTVSSEATATANFGIRSGGAIYRVVFNDLDGDLTQDPGEPGIGGVTVTLNSGTPDIEVVLTGADGSYLFSGLSIAEHSVQETVPAGFELTTGETNPKSITLTL